MPEQSSHHSSTKGIALSLLPRSQGDYHLNPEQEKMTMNFVTKQHSESKQRNKTILWHYFSVIRLSFPEINLHLIVPLSVLNHENLNTGQISLHHHQSWRGKTCQSIVPSKTPCNDTHRERKAPQVPRKGLTATRK